MSSLLLKLYIEDSENVHVKISFCLAFSTVKYLVFVQFALTNEI